MYPSFLPGDTCRHGSADQQIWQTISVQVHRTHTGAEVRSQLHKHNQRDARCLVFHCFEWRMWRLSGFLPLFRTLERRHAACLFLLWRCRPAHHICITLTITQYQQKLSHFLSQVHNLSQHYQEKLTMRLSCCCKTVSSWQKHNTNSFKAVHKQTNKQRLV